MDKPVYHFLFSPIRSSQVILACHPALHVSRSCSRSSELQSLHGSPNLEKIQDSGSKTKTLILFFSIIAASIEVTDGSSQILIKKGKAFQDQYGEIQTLKLPQVTPDASVLCLGVVQFWKFRTSRLRFLVTAGERHSK